MCAAKLIRPSSALLLNFLFFCDICVRCTISFLAINRRVNGHLESQAFRIMKSGYEKQRLFRFASKVLTTPQTCNDEIELWRRLQKAPQKTCTLRSLLGKVPQCSQSCAPLPSPEESCRVAVPFFVKVRRQVCVLSLWITVMEPAMCALQPQEGLFSACLPAHSAEHTLMNTGHSG